MPAGQYADAVAAVLATLTPPAVVKIVELPGLQDEGDDIEQFIDARRDAGDPPEKPQEPQTERCIVSGTTVEALAPLLLANPRGLLLQRDESAGWIGSFDRYSGGGKGNRPADRSALLIAAVD